MRKFSAKDRVTAELVLTLLRKRDFAVLSTVSEEKRPHSAGVNYGVSRPGRDFAIFVMTRRHLQKARNIAVNPAVSLVVPLMRRVLWFLPPPTIQLHGRAEILDWTDEDGTDVFRRFWMGRRILEAYRASHRLGETRICFLKITPDPPVYTYMVGHRIWERRERMKSGAGKVVIPPRVMPRWTSYASATRVGDRQGRVPRSQAGSLKEKNPLADVARDLEQAVARHKFGVLGVHDLKAKMEEKGVPFARECRIFEVCNPHQAKKVLEANLEISTALPCRISLYEEGQGTKLATIKPTAMIELYATPGLQGVAKDVEATLEAIMREAAR